MTCLVKEICAYIISFFNIIFGFQIDIEIRYATPCFMLGTFIGLVALIIAIGGRCTGPDRTLICSSLHILAGT